LGKLLMTRTQLRYMLSRQVTFTLVIALISAFAIGGTPCPDPYTYKVVDGQCVFNTGCLPPGFYAAAGSHKDGGCQTPGTSAYTCEKRGNIVNQKDGVGNGAPFDDSCDGTAYPTCTLQTTTLFGLLSGYSTTTACSYM